MPIRSAKPMSSCQRIETVLAAPERRCASALGAQLWALRAKLRRYAVALTRDRDRAEDLVQDSYVHALEKAARFAPGTDLRAWLFTLMHNLHVSHVRRALREAEAIDGVDLAAAGGDAATEPQQRSHMLLRDVASLLDHLPQPQREVLLLAAEGFTYDEIAAALGLPLGTVRSRMSRGRTVLRAAAEGEVCVRAHWRSVA